MPGAGNLHAFSQAITARAGRMSTLAKDAQSTIDDGLRGIARKAARRAAALTPRSDEATDHIADHWTTEEKKSGGGVEVRVFNDSDRGNAPIQLLDGGVTTLMRILEYGSRAHQIPARAGGPGMTFYWPRRNKMVFNARLIEHPGTNPYAMAATARTEAAVDMKQLYDAVRTVIRLALAGKTSVLTGRTNPFGGASGV